MRKTKKKLSPFFQEVAISQKRLMVKSWNLAQINRNVEIRWVSFQHLDQKLINFNESTKNDVASFPVTGSQFFFGHITGSWPFFPKFFVGVMKHFEVFFWVMKLLRSIIRVMKPFGPIYWVMKHFGHVGKSGPTRGGQV